MEELLNRILSSELEEFELDSTASYSADTVQGQYNQEAANLLMGVYEVIFPAIFLLFSHFYKI